MEKTGGAKEGGKWQQRWFELQDFKLSYYKSPPEPGKKSVAKGIIPITPRVVISCATSMGVKGEQVQDRMIEGTGFVVRDPSKNRDYNFRTETAEQVRSVPVLLDGVTSGFQLHASSLERSCASLTRVFDPRTGAESLRACSLSTG